MTASFQIATQFRNVAYTAPYLEREEERVLIANVQNNNCMTSARALAESHFRYVASVARKFAKFGVDVEDLIQQGCIGLLKAIKTFNLNATDVRFITYAALHVKAEITVYVLDNVRSYRIATTKAQKKLFFNLNRYRDVERSTLSAHEVSLIAEELNVSEEDVRLMESKLRGGDMSIHDEENEDVVQTLACRSNPALEVEQEQWEQAAIKQVHEAISHLNEQERDVFYHRVVVEEKTTLRELAQKHGVSAERIRQVEVKATAKVREFVERFA